MKLQNSFLNSESKGMLYLVPTPIGNLDDMTFRAIKVLKEADLIAAEDTRNTQKLLNYFEIDTKQISFHEHNTEARIGELVEMMKQGTVIAQVSDAGMPSISDPGKELVKACVENDINVVPLPGANAALTALIASGINPQPFYFFGFLPRKKQEQKAMLEQLQNYSETLIFYEAPHRLKKTVQALQAAFGDSRKITLGRELTKRYEEFIRGTMAEVVAWTNNNEIRGEFVIIIEGNANPISEPDELTNQLSSLTVEEQVDFFVNQGNSVNGAIKEVAKFQGVKKQVIYNQYHHLN